MQPRAITLGHGSGGLQSRRFITETILKYFRHPILKRLEDAAELGVCRRPVAFTTDAYVIDPIFFPGGDIGMLAVTGTVNDLAMKGAVPRYVALAMVLEEGLPFTDLERILASAARTAARAGVAVVCGDTKVVPRGKADRLFVVTSGIGEIIKPLAREKIRPGDAVLVSGTIGDHGVVVMNERLQLGLRGDLRSDCAPLGRLTTALLRRTEAIHFMRDPTRGGVSAVLHEAAQDMPFGIVVEEANLPVRRQVRAACEILGLEPLDIPNEGKFVAFVGARDAARVLSLIRKHRLGRQARIIGKVVSRPRGTWITTGLGVRRPLIPPEAEGLPRIC